MLSIASSGRRRTALRLLLTALAALFVGLPTTGASATPHTLSAGDDLTCVASARRCDRNHINPSVASEEALAPITSLSVGRDAACGISTNGHPVCSGVGYPYARSEVSDEDPTVVTSGVTTEVPRVGLASMVAQGDHHACAVTLVGAVWCWGTDGSAGELGDGSTPGPQPYEEPPVNTRSGWIANGPVQARGIARAVDIAVGGSHSCAVLDTGSVRCWGAGSAGQLGLGSAIGSATPRTVGGLDDATAVAGGSAHTCALRANGRIACWGANDHGQVGDGSRANSPSPVAVVGITDAVEVAAGGDSTCARLRAGSVLCWGRGEKGQLGDGGLVDRTAPVAVDGIVGATQIAVGTDHACAAGLGPVSCWGDGYSAALGTPVVADRLGSVGPAPQVSRISAGTRHTCATRPDGSARCWGLGKDGRLGNLRAETRRWPARVWHLDGVTSIAAGDRHSCAVIGDGSLRCWGFNLYGQLGNGTTKTSYGSVPVNGREYVGQFALDAVATQVAVGDRFACRLSRIQSVSCWGFGSNGRLGNGHASSLTPLLVRSPLNAVSISAGGSTVCAVTATTQVVCWGAGSNGWLSGKGIFPPISLVTVPGLTGVTQVSVGAGHACARWIDAGGAAKVSCWGLGASGELGNGLTQNSTTPVLVSGLDAPSQVSAGGRKSCAVVAQGAVRCWGADRLGDGTTNPSPTPVTVQGLTGVSEVSAGDEHTCAWRPTLAPVCWGRGVEGELGQDALDSSNVPVDVAGGVRQIAK